MVAKRIVLYTFGVFWEPFDSPVNDAFHARNDDNFRAAEMSEGIIARSGYEGDPGPESWGEHTYPRFYNGVDHSPSTLSLWHDLISPMAFSYAGIHADAMRHAREWFVKPEWPRYALWWVEQNHRPDWAEAVKRHEYLHDHGPSRHAFDFKNAFDNDGQPFTIDRTALKRIIEINQQRQRKAGLTGTHT
jgi:Domain of unknown function (DUF3291)